MITFKKINIVFIFLFYISGYAETYLKYEFQKKDEKPNIQNNISEFHKLGVRIAYNVSFFSKNSNLNHSVYQDYLNFNVGIFYHQPVSNFFLIVTELNYNRSNLGAKSEDSDYHFAMNNITLPLMFVLRPVRWLGIYVGPAFNYTINVNKKLTETSIPIIEEKLNPFSVNVITGMGTSINNSSFGVIYFDLRYSFALKDNFYFETYQNKLYFATIPSYIGLCIGYRFKKMKK